VLQPYLCLLITSGQPVVVEIDTVLYFQVTEAPRPGVTVLAGDTG
jgi:hypothetical protein